METVEQKLSTTIAQQAINCCIISPICGLEQFSSLSSYQFALAHVALKSKKYCDYFKRRRALGDYIYLDNGAYEQGKPLELEEILHAQRSAANCIILPDFPLQDAKQTIMAGFEAVHQLESYGLRSKLDLMYVPQSSEKDLRGFIESYKFGTSLEGVTHIGLSRLACPNLFPDIPMSWSRIRTILELKIRGVWSSKVKHHALGWLHSLEEFRYLAYFGVHSFDTAAPVWHGHHARGIDTYAPVPDVDFFIKDLQHKDMIDKNIRILLQSTYL